MVESIVQLWLMLLTGKANSGAGGGGGSANGTALQRSGGVGGSGLILIAYPE